MVGERQLAVARSVAPAEDTRAPTYDTVVDLGPVAWPILGLSVLASLVGVAGIGAARRSSTRGGAVVVPAMTLAASVAQGRRRGRSSAMEIIARAGFMGWPILGLSAAAVLCGLAGIAVAMGARSRGAAVVLPGITVLLVLVVAAAGVAGYAWGMRQVNAVLATVDPSSRASLEARGREEARENLVLAGFGSALPLLLGLGGLALAATRKLDAPGK